MSTQYSQFSERAVMESLVRALTAGNPETTVRFVKQPASAHRFRYSSEIAKPQAPEGSKKASVGTIKGASSGENCKIYPTIEVSGHEAGRTYVLVVSCVSHEAPHRPHPHSLVGKDCSQRTGICRVLLSPAGLEPLVYQLRVNIKCAKLAHVETELRLRHHKNLDPFKTGFDPSYRPHMSKLRLAVQLWETEGGEFKRLLVTDLSDIITDQKYANMEKIIIKDLSHTGCSVMGDQKMTLVCSKLPAGSISVCFYEQSFGPPHWLAHGRFEQADVHERATIVLRTPAYKDIHIEQETDVKVLVMLVDRNGKTRRSDPCNFTYYPLPRQAFHVFRDPPQQQEKWDIFHVRCAQEPHRAEVEATCAANYPDQTLLGILPPNLADSGTLEEAMGDLDQMMSGASLEDEPQCMSGLLDTAPHPAQ